MTSYEEWLEAFQRAYSAPDRVPELACPNCWAKELHLRFVTYDNQESGANVAFWCGNCLRGIAPGPSDVPTACPRVRHEDANIPNCRIVPPTGRDGSGSQS